MGKPEYIKIDDSPMLKRVSHVFSISRWNEGTFLISEECDQVFTEELTPDELIQLADEIRAIAQTSSRSTAAS